MLAVTAPTFTEPSGYEITQLPRPQVTDKGDVVIRVHAASVNPIDVKKASGAFKAAIKES
jgi:NADPH:quinone reductase-like Zn-dependent oxidoreductase